MNSNYLDFDLGNLENPATSTYNVRVAYNSTTDVLRIAMKEFIASSSDLVTGSDGMKKSLETARLQIMDFGNQVVNLLKTAKDFL